MANWILRCTLNPTLSYKTQNVSRTYEYFLNSVAQVKGYTDITKDSEQRL